MRWTILLLLWGATLAARPAAAQSSAAWTTFLKPYQYNDLLADGDTVWCATQEAGLLQFVRTSSTFVARVREPGRLGSNRLTALALDRSRRLWVGTEGEGLSVLAADRGSWVAVNAFDGLPSDTVNTIETQGDTLWIGTPQGIALWNGSEIAGVLPDRSGLSPFASNVMRGIAVAGDSLWLATANGAYRSRLSTGLRTWTAVNAGLRTRDLRSLAAAPGVLMTLDSLRALRFDAGSDAWVATPDIGNVHRLSDDRGVIVASTPRGLHVWNGAAWDRINSQLLSSGQPRVDFAVGVDDLGRFVAANRTGLHLRPAGAGTWPVVVPPAPPGNDVLNVALEDDRVYVGTFDEGVGRWDGTRWKLWPPIPGGLGTTDTSFRSPAFSFALLADRVGRKWVGCWDGALEEFDDATSPPQFVHHFQTIGPCCPQEVCQPACRDTTASHTFAWAAAADSVGGRWFGMTSSRSDQLAPIGLEYYDASGSYAGNFRPGNSQLRGSEIKALTVDPGGRIWVGYTGQGIDAFDWPPPSGSRPLVIPMLETGDNVAGLVATRDAVWALTSEEVLKLSRAGDVLGSYDLPGGPFDNAVNPIEAAPDGSIWVGTKRGIMVIPPQGAPYYFTTDNSPLATDGVRAIRIDRRSGVVWIGTGGGLNRFDPAYVPPVEDLPRLEVWAYPNPARVTALGVGIRLAGNGSDLRGAIYDLNGRLIHRFRATGSGGVVWNGRGPDGEPVKPGVYFVRAVSGGRAGTTRIALVR